MIQHVRVTTSHRKNAFLAAAAYNDRLPSFRENARTHHTLSPCLERSVLALRVRLNLATFAPLGWTVRGKSWSLTRLKQRWSRRDGADQARPYYWAWGESPDTRLSGTMLRRTWAAVQRVSPGNRRGDCGGERSQEGQARNTKGIGGLRFMSSEERRRAMMRDKTRQNSRNECTG